jgi:hypothetical protein
MSVLLAALAAAPAALAQRPPVHATRSIAPEIRLGDEIVAFPSGTVSVPIFLKHGKKDDGVRVSIDYDSGLIGYAWYRTAGSAWRVERVAPYGQSRIGIVLRATADAVETVDGQETLALHAVFYLQPGANPGRELSMRSILSLGATDSGHGLDSYYYSRNTDGTDRPLRTIVRNGSVTVYFRDGVEVGGGALTQRPQELTLPVYLTSLGDLLGPAGAGRTLTIGVDYDEIFLGLVDVRLRSPPAASSAVSVVDDPVLGRATFPLTLQDSVQDVFCRLHVADLVLEYHGGAPAEAVLEVKGQILPEGGFADSPGEPQEEAGDDGLGAAGTTSPASTPAQLVFLPPYFVRGNADSSARPDGKGGVSVTGDLLDVRLILEAVFLGHARPACEDAADVSDDGQVELEDVILLLNHLFRGGPQPVSPYPQPGPDGRTGQAGAADADGLGCLRPLPYFTPAATAR